MRFLVDAQLPPALCHWLGEKGHDAVHVSMVLSGETPDKEVAAYAAAQERVVLTKDDDFTFRHWQDGLVVVWCRIGNASNRALVAWLEPRWHAIEQALLGGERLVEVL